MDVGDVIKEINKTFELLICSCNNNIVKKDFTNILNLIKDNDAKNPFFDLLTFIFYLLT